MGIFILSSRGISVASATVAVIAPKNARTGCIKKIANEKVATKHARLPSKLLGVFKNCLFPCDFPTMAATVSPIAKNDNAIKAISGVKIAIQNTDDIIRYVAPVKSLCSCFLKISPNILKKIRLNVLFRNRNSSTIKAMVASGSKIIKNNFLL